MNDGSRVIVGVLVVAALAGGAFFFWRRRHTPPPPPPPPIVQPVTPIARPAPLPVDAAPAIRNPIEPEAAPSRGPLPALADADAYVKGALIDLLGRKSVQSFLNVDGFARRFVATVDNLAGEHASVHLWPVNPTAGRFEAEVRGDGTVIASKNAQRYAPFIRWLASVDTHRAVALYRRLYPLFQQAYDELGFQGKYFNDRVVEVIDDLLATPDIAGPIKLRRIEIPSADKRTPPRVVYQFEDSALESRPAGQKILLRLGRENADKVKATLSEVRRQIVKGPGR